MVSLDATYLEAELSGLLSHGRKLNITLNDSVSSVTDALARSCLTSGEVKTLFGVRRTCPLKPS